MNDRGPCEYCPCPGACLGWDVWCRDWAPSGDPVLRAHIRNRSAGPAAGPAATPGLAATIAAIAAMNVCPYRSAPGCGCSGGRCGLRGGAAVSHVDCLSCLERYG
jgi:hypothetical protein